MLVISDQYELYSCFFFPKFTPINTSRSLSRREIGTLAEKYIQLTLIRQNIIHLNTKATCFDLASVGLYYEAYIAKLDCLGMGTAAEPGHIGRGHC